ncbi:hypothetical protein CK220_06555 [Mesorhizobium sp. WSM3860]|nr:hypothetical protein CK220_06555 [Mesorhizobium sp. WSM3860]
MCAVRKQTLTVALPAAIYWQKRHQHRTRGERLRATLVADCTAQASPGDHARIIGRPQPPARHSPPSAIIMTRSAVHGGSGNSSVVISGL